jgi:hypothetical protein
MKETDDPFLSGSLPPRAQLNVLAKPASWIAVFSFVFFSFCAESSPRRGEPTLTNRN